MIRSTMKHVQVLNGVIARSANSVPQFKKPVTSLLAPSVGGTLLHSKMYGSHSESFSHPTLPTAEVIKFTKDVKEDVEKAAKRQFPKFKPVLFCKQDDIHPEDWNGAHFHVKVQTDEHEFIKVCVVRPKNGGDVRFDGPFVHQTRDDSIRKIRYPGILGGYSDVLLATPYIIHKAGELKGAVENAIGANFSEFKAVLYRYQVVAGTNYMVKVQTSSDVYVHMKMFQGLPLPTLPPVELTGYEYPKTREDPLV